jgi:uncharacterized protein (DUF1697 family)
MGIRINSAIVYGVKFTREETSLYDKTMEGKERNYLLKRWVEFALDIESKGEGRYQSCYQAYNFAKFDKKGKILKPYRPFWVGMSEKALKKDLMTLAGENLKTHGRVSEAEGVDRFRLWEPDRDTEDKPQGILGIVDEINYDRSVDYGLVDVFKISGVSNKVLVLKGKRPWECGTTCLKDRPGEWHTHNGENMLPIRWLPKNKAKEIVQQVLYHKGTREEFIEKKRELWLRYHHKEMKPYKSYACDPWGWTDSSFYPVDLLYQLVAKIVPGIKYDVMRLEKMLCLYWS